MQAKAAILTVLYLFFFVQFVHMQVEQTQQVVPVAESSCCKQSTSMACSKEAPVKVPDDKSGCIDCSAYIFCPFCIYTIPEQLRFSDVLVNINPVNTLRAHNFVLSSYQADCWHPPELS